VSIRPLGMLYACPARENSATFAMIGGPRGILQITRALVQGMMNLDENLANVVYQCTTCGCCNSVCNKTYEPTTMKHYDFPLSTIIDHTRIWESLRADLVNAGYGPMPRQREVLSWIEKENNPYMEKHSDRLKWIPQGKIIPTKGDVVYFTGCTEPYRMPGLCKAFSDVLNAARINYAVMPDEWCCGSVAFRTGDRALAKKLAEHNVKALLKAGAKVVVAHCSGCYRTLKIDYPEILGKELPFEIQHATEFVQKMIKDGLFVPQIKIDSKVTWHDPCHLGRHVGIYEAPREILKAIGLELVEMRRNKQYALCCGAGGGVKSAFPNLAVKIACDRILEAEETGAKYLASACPFCDKNLQDAVKATGSKIQVYDVLELLTGVASQ
jgi:heterodisulfide reductase subunit D